MTNDLPYTWTATSADDGRTWSTPVLPPRITAGTRHEADGTNTADSFYWNSVAAIRLPLGATCIAVNHHRYTQPINNTNFMNSPAPAGSRAALIVCSYQPYNTATTEGTDIVFSGRRYSA